MILTDSGGCAAVTACDLCIYLARQKGMKALYPYQADNPNRTDYLAFSVIMKQYLHPSWQGIDTLEQYLSGLSAYWKHSGADTLKADGLHGTVLWKEAAGQIKERILALADDDISEITAHAYGVRITAPKEYRPGIVVDIGGQDSKIIYLDSHYNIRNFTMNDKCAAGTGKFLEIAAQILETTTDEIGPLSLESRSPCDINSTCVVFAQSEVISLVARKFDRRDILYGMHLSMAKRIIKMMKSSEKGGNILMTGGGAKNIGICRAFEEELMREIYVADYPQFNGAIGAALIASERGREQA